MKAFFLSIALMSVGFVLTACTTGHNDMHAKSAIAHLEHHEFGHTTHHLKASAGGVVVGGIHSPHRVRTMDQMDRTKLYHALEMNTTETWINPRSGYRYIAEPVRTYHWRHYQYCREYVTRVFVGHRWETVHGTACRTPGGYWRTMN